MKHLYILTASILLTFNSLSANTYQDTKTIEKRINNILFNLDSIITNSDNKNDIVEQHFRFVKSKLSTNELTLVYDTTLNYDFYGCASFNIASDNKDDVQISFGPYLLDKYKAHPFLVYAILIHTFQYAYDYYNNQNLFLISLENPIEKTYFEIDALMLEAIFLKTYVKDYKSLGYVEKYLIMDLQNNMNGSAALFDKTDLELLHSIDNLKTQSKGSDKILKDYAQIGQDLIKNLSFENKSNWEKYCDIVKIKTYVFYSRQVIFDIVHLKDGVEQDTFKLEDFAFNLQIINEIQRIINENKAYLSYHDDTLEKYAKYYK